MLEDIVEHYKHISKDTVETISIATQTESVEESNVQVMDRKRARSADDFSNKRTRKSATDEIVTCPLCFNQVYYSKLNHHMDLNCSKETTFRGLEGDKTNSSGETKSDSEFKHKPSVPYGFHKDEKIRKMLRVKEH